MNRPVVAGATCAVDGKQLVDWTFEQCHLDRKHCVSVCVRAPPAVHTPVPFIFMDATQLVEQLGMSSQSVALVRRLGAGA